MGFEDLTEVEMVQGILGLIIFIIYFRFDTGVFLDYLLSKFFRIFELLEYPWKLNGGITSKGRV